MRELALLQVVILIVCLLGGCSSERAGVVLLEQQVPHREISSAPMPSGNSDEPVSSVEPTDVVTLRQAISLALMHNPSLQIYSFEVRAAEARQLQAGLRPNPEMEIGTENFGGTGAMAAVDSAETTIQLGQLVELSGKRAKRMRLASIEKELAQWDYESRRWDVYAEVTKAFVTVLAAQEEVALREEIVGISQQMWTAVDARVEAGKDPPLERTKAEVGISKARIESRKAADKLQSARQQLAAAWGQTVARFEKVAGGFESVSPVPRQAVLVEKLTQNPEISRLSDEIEARRVALALEKAKAVPDPTLFGGMRYLAEDSDNAFVFGVGIPIPLFDRNQGRVLEAVQELAKASARDKALRIELHATLIQAYKELSAAYDEVTALRSQVLPGAKSAFDTAREGYSEGKFDYLTVLDAQRTLFDARTQYIEALLSYHVARTDVERLTVGPVNSAQAIGD